MVYTRFQRSFNVFLHLLYQYYIELRDSIFQYSPEIKLNEIIYYDFETTGLNPYHNKIIEYAFLEHDSNYYITELVNPECKFEKKITDITGIHPDDLEDETPIEAHITNIINFITPEDRPIGFQTYLIAHNNDGFDKIFLNETINRINQNPSSKFPLPRLKIDCQHIDTLLLAKKLLPELNSHSLKNLAIHFKIKAGTHRALDDTKCLREVYIKLLEVLSTKDRTYGNSMTLIENPDIVYDYLYKFK